MVVAAPTSIQVPLGLFGPRIGRCKATMCPVYNLILWNYDYDLQISMMQLIVFPMYTIQLCIVLPSCPCCPPRDDMRSAAPLDCSTTVQ